MTPLTRDQRRQLERALKTNPRRDRGFFYALTFSRRMSVGVMQARVSKIWTCVGKR